MKWEQKLKKKNSCLITSSLLGSNKQCEQVLDFIQLVVLLFMCEFEGWPFISHSGQRPTGQKAPCIS